MTHKEIHTFTIEHKIVFFYLIFRVFAVSIYPSILDIKADSYLFDLVFLYFFLIANFHPYKFLNLRFNVKNYTEKFLIITIFFVIFSTFYINIENNLNIQAIGRVTIYLFQFYILYFFLAKELNDDKNLFEKFLNGILIFCTISSIFSLLSLHFGYNSEGRKFVSSVGFFLSPNTTSFVYTFAFPILSYKYLIRKISLLPFILLLVLFLYCLLFTYSRAGFVGCLTTILILTFFHSKRYFIITLALLIITTSSLFLDILLLKSDSSLSRSLLTLTAVGLITHDVNTLLWGYGTSYATKIFEDQKSLYGNFELNVSTPHNFILLFILQYGIITLLPFLFFLINLIFRGIRIRSIINDDQRKKGIELSVSIILGLIAQNLFEDVFVMPEFPVMPLVLVFLGYLYYNLVKKSTKNLKLFKTSYG
ncbi:MAG: hypothetical protein FJ216_04180 [Ignavibacteria bacterium]|nr:hypothetical protein [Ignavibacteria bacterium]